MHLDTLRYLISQYAAVLVQSPHLYLWDAQQRFQYHWDPGASDFAAMFDRALNSQISRRLWSAHAYQPKQNLLLFMQWQPEQTRAMFLDLLDERKEVVGRIQRFQFVADELLADWQAERRQPLLPAHDQDTAAVTLYLSMAFPDRYAPYHHGLFTRGLRALRVARLPEVEDPARWFTLSGTVLRFLREDAGLMTAYACMRRDPMFFQGDTLLLSYDFFRFAGEEKG